MEAILEIELSSENEAKVISWAKAQIGEGYGWKDIIDEAFHDEILKPSAMDCSHYVSKALAQGGFLISRKPFFQNTPADVYNCTGLKLVKEIK